MRYALWSVGVGLAVLGLKLLAFWLTGSVGLLSDALESVVNVVASGAALLALWVARQPADAQHPYGHHKAEYFSAVLEGVLIVLAALSILRSAYDAFITPRPLEGVGWGLLVSLLATALNAGWSAILARAGRRLRSPALLADARHIGTDVVTSVGVLLGVGLAALSGLRWLDPAVAVLVACNIVWVGFRLVGSGVSSLLDEAAPEAVQRRIKALVQAHAVGALEAHDFRTRHAGSRIFVDFHLVVPGQMTVESAHAICDALEARLEAEMPGVEVTIHLEPESAAQHQGIVVL